MVTISMKVCAPRSSTKTMRRYGGQALCPRSASPRARSTLHRWIQNSTCRADRLPGEATWASRRDTKSGKRFCDLGIQGLCAREVFLGAGRVSGSELCHSASVEKAWVFRIPGDAVVIVDDRCVEVIEAKQD